MRLEEGWNHPMSESKNKNQIWFEFLKKKAKLATQIGIKKNRTWYYFNYSF
jgi:hypothetical protein